MWDSEEKILNDWNVHWTIGNERVNLMIYDTFDKLYKHLLYNAKRQGDPDRLRFYDERHEMFINIAKEQDVSSNSVDMVSFFKEKKEADRKFVELEARFWARAKRVKTLKSDASSV